MRSVPWPCCDPSTSPCSTWRRRPGGLIRAPCAGVSSGYNRSGRGPGGGGDGGAASVMVSRALLVRFHEPEPLVHAARDLGEDVGAARVLELVHLLDADPHRAAEHGECIRQRRHVLRAGREPEGIVEKGGALRDDPHRTLGNAPALHTPAR